MQIISQEKDPAVGINGFEGVGPEWLLPKTYALSARSKLTASGTVADELRQADMIIIIKTEYSCLFKQMAI